MLRNGPNYLYTKHFGSAFYLSWIVGLSKKKIQKIRKITSKKQNKKIPKYEIRLFTNAGTWTKGKWSGTRLQKNFWFTVAFHFILIHIILLAKNMELAHLELVHLGSFHLPVSKSKVGDFRRGRPDGSLFSSRGRLYSFPWIAPLHPWSVPYITEC